MVMPIPAPADSPAAAAPAPAGPALEPDLAPSAPTLVGPPITGPGLVAFWHGDRERGWGDGSRPICS